MSDIQEAIERAAKLASEARIQENRQYFKAGTKGVATIVSTELKDTKNDGPGFFPSFRIETSEERFKGAGIDKVGEVRNNPIFLNKFDGAGFEQMVRFIKTALDETGPVSKEDFTAVLNDVKSSAQPLTGMQVLYEVSPMKISKKGNPYSTTKFYPLKGQTAESVAKLRKSVEDMLAEQAKASSSAT